MNKVLPRIPLSRESHEHTEGAVATRDRTSDCEVAFDVFLWQPWVRLASHLAWRFWARATRVASSANG